VFDGRTVNDVPAGSVRELQVFCPAGKVVVGGGGLSLSFVDGAFALIASMPVFSPDGWQVRVRNITGIPRNVNIQSWVICVGDPS
jgi:hypothetical protein